MERAEASEAWPASALHTSGLQSPKLLANSGEYIHTIVPGRSANHTKASEPSRSKWWADLQQSGRVSNDRRFSHSAADGCACRCTVCLQLAFQLAEGLDNAAKLSGTCSCTSLYMCCCVLLQVRDQRVQLLPNPDLGMMVRVVDASEKQAAMQQGLKPQQFMMSFTMHDWQLMKQLVPTEACLMPHRGQRTGSPPTTAAGAAVGARRSAKRPRS